jgi:hypothetical protein
MSKKTAKNIEKTDSSEILSPKTSDNKNEKSMEELLAEESPEVNKPKVEPVIVTPTRSEDIPTIDKNAPLRIDQIEEGDENEPQDKSNRKLYFLGGVVLVLIILGVGGFIFLFINNSSDRESAVAPVAQESTQASPSATLPILVRSEWSFEVLNGSGIPGAAKKAAGEMIALGYEVVQTGNADQIYETNELFVSPEMKNETDLLIADLKDIVKISTVAGVLKNSTASARIIIGKQ